MNNLIIDSDIFKKQIIGYNPSKADKFHDESRRMADREYKKAIQSCKYSNLVILSGGSASGKSEFVDSYLINIYDNAIILDGTFSSRLGAENKLRPAIKKKIPIIVYFVQPKSIRASYQAFLARERKFPVEHFIRTHSGARDTFLFILETYPDVQFNYILSSINLDNNKPQFQKLVLTREEVLLIMQNEQLTIEEITNII